MKNKLIVSILLLIICNFQSIEISADNKTKIINAASYCAYDYKTGNLILNYNSSKKLSAASTIKLVTALAASSMINSSDLIIITKEAVAVKGSKAGFKTGEKYTFTDMLNALLVKSANDAAVALAVHAAGSEKKFVLRMNSWCRDNKIYSTNFSDAAGLSAESYTSAKDLAVIFTKFLNDKKLVSILLKTTSEIKSISGRRISFKSTNLLNRFFEGTDMSIIGKTGFTRRAGFCFAGIVKTRDREFIVVIMGASHNWRQLYELISYCESY